MTLLLESTGAAPEGPRCEGSPNSVGQVDAILYGSLLPDRFLS